MSNTSLSKISVGVAVGLIGALYDLYTIALTTSSSSCSSWLRISEEFTIREYHLVNVLGEMIARSRNYRNRISRAEYFFVDNGMMKDYERGESQKESKDSMGTL